MIRAVSRVALPLLSLLLPLQTAAEGTPLPHALHPLVGQDAPRVDRPAPRFGRHGPLTDREMAMARAACSYFEARLQPETGLVNALGSYPSTTLWDTTSYVSAWSRLTSGASSTSANSTASRRL